MISKFAVRKFLQRQLDDWGWLKGCSEKEFDEAISKMNPIPKFHTKPYPHQKAGFLLGLHIPESLLFFDMGTGKTHIILNILAYKNQTEFSNNLKALILVPNLASLGTWVEQGKEHRPDFPLIILEGSSTERWETLRTQNVNGYIINYQGLLALCDWSTKDRKRIKEEIKKLNPKLLKERREIQRLTKTLDDGDPSKREELASFFDAIVLDESTHIKSWRTHTYKLCDWLCARMAIKFALTGTPFGRDPQDLWAQFHAVDQGDTLGRTLGIFRAAFFRENIDYFGRYEYKLLPTMKDSLARTLRHRSLTYSAEECLGMPNRVDQIHPLKMSLEALPYYKKVIEELKKGAGARRVTEIQNSFMRARMITSGFLAARIDDERVEIAFKDNPKQDALRELIQALPSGRKMIVFHFFIRTGALIQNTCKEEGINCLRLYGETKDQACVVREFQNGKMPVMAINYRAGSEALNLQVADYVVFFESPESPIVRQQAEKRIRPEMFKRRVWYHDLVIRDSVDERILDFIKEGKDLLKSLFQGKIIL